MTPIFATQPREAGLYRFPVDIPEDAIGVNFRAECDCTANNNFTLMHVENQNGVDAVYPSVGMSTPTPFKTDADGNETKERDEMVATLPIPPRIRGKGVELQMIVNKAATMGLFGEFITSGG